MVVPSGNWQVQQRVEQTMDVCRFEQVKAAADDRRALPSVIHDDGQVVAGGHVLAGDDHVAECFRLRHLRATGRRGYTRGVAMARIGSVAAGVVADDATGVGVANNALLLFCGITAVVAII